MVEGPQLRHPLDRPLADLTFPPTLLFIGSPRFFNFSDTSEGSFLAVSRQIFANIRQSCNNIRQNFAKSTADLVVGVEHLEAEAGVLARVRVRVGGEELRAERLGPGAKLATLLIPVANSANFWRARSRLYQNELLQENMRLTAFFKLYKICILLHRCNLKILAKNRLEKSAIFLKIQQKLKFCKSHKFL